MNQILIVDDEKLIRDMLASRLQDHGYETILAKNGKEGLELFDEHNPPVTILDLKMPEMDGIELLNELKPDVFLTNAIIVFTGHGDNNDIEQCFKLGVQSFLRKPVNFFELLGSIKRAFDLVNNTLKINSLNSQLHESNQRISSILGNIPDLIWECDNQLRFTYASDNARQVLQYTPDELKGKKITDFLIKEDVEQLNFKFKASKTKLKDSVEGLSVTLKAKDGSPVPMQLLAKGIVDSEGKTEKLLVTARDMKSFSAIADKLETVVEEMTIKIDENLNVLFMDESIRQFLDFELTGNKDCGNLSSCLSDPDSKSLLHFAFSQKEDVPFPIEIKIKDASDQQHVFSTHFKYEQSGPCLEGHLKPLNKDSQIALMFKQVDKRLQNSVEVTPEMKADIVKDSFNLAGETLASLKVLAEFAYSEEEVFNIDEYFQFIKSKRVNVFAETLRIIGNKIHGLKGTTGFILSSAKKLCHQVEELVRPLTEHKIVLTTTNYRLLIKFVYTIQDMLEKYQENDLTEFSVEGFIATINAGIKKSVEYIGVQTSAYSDLIATRGADDGHTRRRKADEYLSVSQVGYGLLSQQVKNLFYMFSETLSDEHTIQAGNLYNEFLDTHQRIQKVPLDLSRYERLIPSLTKQYEKEASFIVNDHDVHADREFWNAIHEILNHTLKNAVIHGLDTPQEREKANKSSVGEISVEIKEDALSIYVSVSDDGRGIDVDKIRKKAIDSMAISPGKIEEMTDDELLYLVFLQGISTADTLDDNAGRGVGLNAVQEAMQTFQGSCSIKSEKGLGCSWDFTFPKSNVSLSCFIVTVDDFRIAIPEDCVEAFYGYNENNISWINQQPNYRQNQDLIPLLDSTKIFDKDVSINQDSIRRILILKTEKEKMGMVINDIIHHANLPIMALPEEYRKIPAYLGATLYGNESVLVINASQIR
ncbi:response regulator [bacterium]|nr:response regulator [bacterium]